MLQIVNTKLVFDPNRCSQCGVCISACPANALSSRLNILNGIYDIAIDIEKCTTCGICVKLCPSNFIYHDRIQKSQLHHLNAFYLGYSNNEKLRYFSSSGGIAKELIKSAISSNEIDAVFTLLYQDKIHNDATGVYLTTDTPYEQIPNSLYRPILWGKHLNKYQKSWNTIMLIGLPCQIKSAEKFFQLYSPKTKLIKIVLICRQQADLRFSAFLNALMNQKNRSVFELKYRGDGWPGIITNYPRYPIGWYLWRLNSCRYCVDCLGCNIADITLGDPWEIVSPKEETIGTNIIFCWTELGYKTIRETDTTLKELNFNSVERTVDFKLIKQKENELKYLLKESVSQLIKLKMVIRLFIEKIYRLQFIQKKLIKDHKFSQLLYISFWRLYRRLC